MILSLFTLISLAHAGGGYEDDDPTCMVVAGVFALVVVGIAVLLDGRNR